jgi:hypothetical protein
MKSKESNNISFPVKSLFRDGMQEFQLHFALNRTRMGHHMKTSVEEMKGIERQCEGQKISLRIDHENITDPEGKRVTIVSSVEIVLGNGTTVKIGQGNTAEFWSNANSPSYEKKVIQSTRTLRVQMQKS